MTVSQLIRLLQGFNGNLRVVTPGFDESDYDDVVVVETIRMEFHDERQRFHGGRHKRIANGVNAVNVSFG